MCCTPSLSGSVCDFARHSGWLPGGLAASGSTTTTGASRSLTSNLKPMRITFVLPCYPWRPSGAFRVVYEYANNLVARGHQVSVVHARHVKDKNGFFASHGLYQHLRGQARSLRDVLLVPKVSWQAIDDRVRLLYVGEPTTASVPDADAVLAATWDTVQYVCQYPRSKGAKFHLVQAYEYWSHLEGDIDALWRSDINKIVISRWLGEKMAELGCNEFSYVPNGINQSKFCLVSPIAGRPKRVAMLYAAAKWKGSADGLHALGIVKENHPDLRAVLFGTTKKPRACQIGSNISETHYRATMSTTCITGAAFISVPA